jgi:agmatine deiminase
MATNQRRFPAEWEEQAGILLCFPHNGNDWPGKYQAIQWAFVEYIKKITAYETVFLVVMDNGHQDKVVDLLTRATVNLDKVSFIMQKTNRSWMRDSGPIVVYKNGTREAINFNFNAWAKYNNYLLDRKIPEIVANHLDIELTQASYKGKYVTLEGGALEVNGAGTMITSEECLLHPTIQVRNQGFTKQDYEAVFATYFGVTHTIWLDKGIVGDDTHGHIDDLCRFVNEDTVVTVVETDPQHENYTPLQENLAILHKATIQDGRPLKVKTLPMPKTILFEGLSLPASYANFLILNQCVLVPTFNDAADRIALNTIAECFPDREVIGISAIDLIWGFGTLHCLSQQIPL